MNRSIRIYTGAGGADLYEEAFEETLGLKRVYIGKKVPQMKYNSVTEIPGFLESNPIQ